MGTVPITVDMLLQLAISLPHKEDKLCVKEACALGDGRPLRPGVSTAASSGSPMARPVFGECRAPEQLSDSGSVFRREDLAGKPLTLRIKTSLWAVDVKGQA